MNSYGKFAGIYDDLMTDFDYEKWFNYIEDILEKNNKKPKNILEMACGTGNLSYYLGNKGYNLTSFDLSTDMLSRADEKLSKFKNVRLLNQNMINFNIYEKFDCIISICDSINYITEKDDLYQSFKNVYDHLEEDGIFIFDINSFYKLKYIIGDNTFVEERENVFYTWENYFDEEDNICEFYLTFFFSEDGKNFQRFHEEHMEKAYKVDEIIELLKRAGFKNIEYFEGFTFQDPVKETERINFVVRK